MKESNARLQDISSVHVLFQISFIRAIVIAYHKESQRRHYTPVLRALDPCICVSGDAALWSGSAAGDGSAAGWSFRWHCDGYLFLVVKVGMSRGLRERWMEIWMLDGVAMMGKSQSLGEFRGSPPRRASISSPCKLLYAHNHSSYEKFLN